MVALGSKDKRALTAAFNYLLIGAVGATFMLLVGFIFCHWHLNIADLTIKSLRLANNSVKAGISFIIMIG